MGVGWWYRGDAVLTCRSRHPSTQPRCPRGSVRGDGEGGGGIGEMQYSLVAPGTLPLGLVAPGFREWGAGCRAG